MVGTNKSNSDDALLSECSYERLKYIAKNFKFTVFSRLKKEELKQLISDYMDTVTECGTCGGGQCLPASHYFAPVQRSVSVTSSPDHDLLDGLGDGPRDQLHDEFLENPREPFIAGGTPQHVAPVDLSAQIRQGGLDQAAAAARDNESNAGALEGLQSQVQDQVQALLAAEKERLAKERQDAAQLRQEELAALEAAAARPPPVSKETAAANAAQAYLKHQMKLLQDESDRIAANEATIHAARKDAIQAGPSRIEPAIRTQPPTPARLNRPPVSQPVPVPAVPSHAPTSGLLPPGGPAHPLGSAPGFGVALPASPHNAFLPPAAPASAPPAGNPNFDFRSLEQMMTNAIAAAVRAAQPAPTAIPSNIWHEAPSAPAANSSVPKELSAGTSNLHFNPGQEKRKLKPTH